MKTLLEHWTSFYQGNVQKLTLHYPGLSQNRFLREVEDLIAPLSVSEYQISPRKSLELKKDFLKGKPLAYMQGFAEFYQHRFYVNADVLVPRPETELLVDILNQEKRSFERVLDVGVGSGVILLSLLALLKAKTGVGVDISAKALHVARINARRLRLEDRAELRISDRLENVHEKFDLIVSNPPYIKESSHRDLVHRNVDQYEPHVALYLPDDKYEEWFREFFSEIKKALIENGVFMMEGHELELVFQQKMLKESGFKEVSVIQDLSGKDRFLRAVC